MEAKLLTQVNWTIYARTIVLTMVFAGLAYVSVERDLAIMIVH
jgi:hypothetical protein